MSALGLILLKILAAKTIFLSTLALLLAALQFFKHSGGGHSGKLSGSATTIDGGKNIEITAAAKRRNSDCAAVVAHYNQGEGLTNLGSTLGDANLEMIGQPPLSAQINYDFNRRNVHQRADYEVFPDSGQGPNPYGNQGPSKQFGPNDYYRQNNDPFGQSNHYVINSEPLSANAIVLNEHVNRRQDGGDKREVVRVNKNTDRREDPDMDEDNTDEADGDGESKRKYKNKIDNTVDHLRENYHPTWKNLEK